MQAAFKCQSHARNPIDHEWRRQIAYDRVLAQALLTAVGIGLLGLVSAAVLGLRGTDIGRHISFGFFSTMVMLLAHSMMMFYLIGKGKAVKDAMAEAQPHRRLLPPDRRGAEAGLLRRHARDGGHDGGGDPRRQRRHRRAAADVHAMIAYGAIVCNVAARQDRDRRALPNPPASSTK